MTGDCLWIRHKTVNLRLDSAVCDAIWIRVSLTDCLSYRVPRLSSKCYNHQLTVILIKDFVRWAQFERTLFLYNV